MVDGFVIFKKNFETYRTRVPWDVTRRIIAALRDVGANAVTDAKRAETRTVIIAESFMTMHDAQSGSGDDAEGPLMTATRTGKLTEIDFYF